MLDSREIKTYVHMKIWTPKIKIKIKKRKRKSGPHTFTAPLLMIFKQRKQAKYPLIDE